MTECWQGPRLLISLYQCRICNTQRSTALCTDRLLAALCTSYFCTRSEFAFIVVKLSESMEHLTVVFLKDVKDVLQYLKGSASRKIAFGSENSKDLEPYGYCNANYSDVPTVESFPSDFFSRF